MADTEDTLISRLGTLHQQLEQLENVDYMTAYYKGYSTQGDDLETIKEKLSPSMPRFNAPKTNWQPLIFNNSKNRG